MTAAQNSVSQPPVIPEVNDLRTNSFNRTSTVKPDSVSQVMRLVPKSAGAIIFHVAAGHPQSRAEELDQYPDSGLISKSGATFKFGLSGTGQQVWRFRRSSR